MAERAARFMQVRLEAFEDDALVHAVGPITEINRACIDRLCSLAATPATVPLVRRLSPVWCGLSEQSRDALACLPVLLVDASFGDGLFWRSLQLGGVQDLPYEPASCLQQGDQGLRFSRRVLLYAWHLVRADRALARLALGMSLECIDCIATLRLEDLDHLTESHPGLVRPRWEQRVSLWRQFLGAANRLDVPALQRLGLRSVQMLAGGALGPLPPPGSSR